MQSIGVKRNNTYYLMAKQSNQNCIFAMSIDVNRPHMTAHRYNLVINIALQTLQVWQQTILVREYSISSAANGVGEQVNSLQTPRGEHIIRAKIGQGCEVNAVFVGRRPTGEIFAPLMKEQFPNRDWILTRILWLSGCEKNKNRGGNIDTMRRYIYIHGAPDEVAMGVPGSHGCIRMRNSQLIELFDLIPVYTPVNIIEA